MNQLTELTILNGAMRLNYDLLFASPTNPRRHFDEVALQELSLNIEEHGILQPLLVRLVGQSYEIVAGERRYRGLGKALERLAGEEKKGLYAERFSVPVIVRAMSDGQVLELQLIENLQRQDLTPLEEAEGYQRLLDLKGEDVYTPERIATQIGKSVDTVLNKLKMLRAPVAMREALERGECSERHLILVATIPGERMREKAGKEILKGNNWQKPLTIETATRLINEEYRRSLKGVAFSLEDAELLPEAGPCMLCPHFAKKAAEQDKDLAEELGNERGKLDPQTCLQPGCYRDKMNALLKRKQAEAKEQQVELKVLTKDETEKVFVSPERATSAVASRSGMVKLADKLGSDIYGHYDEKKMITWREATEGMLPPGAIVLAKMEDGTVVELVDLKVAKAAAKEHPKHGKLFKKEAKVELNPEQERQKEREAFERRQKEHGKLIILDLIDEKAAIVGMDEETMMVVLNVALMDAGSDGCKLLAAWLKLELKAPVEGMHLNQTHVRETILEHLKVRGTTKAELDRLVLMAMLSNWIKIYGCDFDGLAPVEQRFGFDSKTVMALAKSKVQAEDAEKKAKSKAKAPKAKGNEEIISEVTKADILAKGDEERLQAPSHGLRREGGSPLIECKIKGAEDAAGVYEQLKCLDVPAMVKNANGVFEKPARLICEITREVRFEIMLATDGAAHWSKSVEYDIGMLTGGGLPSDGHVFMIRESAVAEAVRRLVSAFKAKAERKVEKDAVKARAFLNELKKLAERDEKAAGEAWNAVNNPQDNIDEIDEFTAAELEACRVWRKNNPGAGAGLMADALSLTMDEAYAIIDKLVDEKHDAIAAVKQEYADQDFENQAKLIAAGKKKPSDFIGKKPSPDKDPEAYKKWSQERMRLVRAADKLKQAA